MVVEWDSLKMSMEALACDYLKHFTLLRDELRLSWINRPLGIYQSFFFGDAPTVPQPPFEHTTRQSQGDFVLMDLRGNLFIDAGIVISQADWSLDFHLLVMNFMKGHAPGA